MAKRNRNSQLIKKTRIEPVGHAMFTYIPTNDDSEGALTPKTIRMGFVRKQIEKIVGADKIFAFKINSITYYGVRGGNSVAAQDALNRDILSDNVANTVEIPLFPMSTRFIQTSTASHEGQVVVDPTMWTVANQVNAVSDIWTHKLCSLEGKLPSSSNDITPLNGVRAEISVTYFVLY